MADIAASPDDPMFINHHTMVDCILEEWLQGHPGADYPTEQIEKHQKNGYIVLFYLLFKHKDMFKTADNFGYSCNLENITESGSNHNVHKSKNIHSSKCTLQIKSMSE